MGANACSHRFSCRTERPRGNVLVKCFSHKIRCIADEIHAHQHGAASKILRVDCRSGNSVAAHTFIIPSQHLNVGRQFYRLMVVFELGIRHVKPKFILLVIASFLHCSAPAQSSSAASKVGLTVKLSPETPHPGSEISATVLVSIAEGWHINSSAPSDENLIATALSFQTVPGVTVADVRFPAAEERRFGFSDAPVEVYEGTISIEASLRIGENLKPGTYTIPVILTYQACNDNVCLAPTSVRTEIILTVASMKYD